MQSEKRKFKRTDIFFIIQFRLIHNSYEYALGVSRNYSDDGFNLETHNFGYKPGQLLECTLWHPESDASVSIVGEIVWKKDGWYDAVMGIKFFHVNESTVKSIRELSLSKRKESMPVLSEDSVISTAHEKCLQNMGMQTESSEETENHPVSKRVTNTPFRPRPSSKLRQSYFLFFVFLVLSTVIIFSVVARDGKDVFPWITFSDRQTDIPLPAQGNMATAVLSNVTSAIIKNDRDLIPSEKDQVKELLKEAALPKDIISDKITFDVKSAEISPEFYSVLDKVADILLGSPGLSVILEGHTDSAGSEIYNMNLSMRRAAAVRSELINRGIHSSRIKIICFGNSNPAASNDVASGRMKNRRVEISIPLSES